MSYFDKAFSSAFPAKEKFPSYSWPKMSRPMVYTKLEPTSITPGTVGQREAIADKPMNYGKFKPGPGGTYVGGLTAWTRDKGATGGNTKGSLSPKMMTFIKFVAAAPIGIIGVLGMIPARQVTKKNLQVSHHSLTPGTPEQGASSGRRKFDPFGDFNFHIQIEGVAAGAFTKIDGIDLEIDKIEYRDSLDSHPHSRPGIHRYGNIKLTKGVIENTALWEWCLRIMAGEMDRRNGTIDVYNDSGDNSKPEASFNFFAAWPCKWSGMRVDGKGGATLVEDLELAIDSFDRA